MKTLLCICKGIIVIGFLNLTAFILIAICLGGDAVAGGASDGHYYLSAHGHRTEVPRAVWLYSRAHFYTGMASAPAVIVAGIACGLIRKKYPTFQPSAFSP